MIYCWSKNSENPTTTIPIHHQRQRGTLSANSSFKFINSSGVYCKGRKTLIRSPEGLDVFTITVNDHLEIPIDTHINNIPRSRTPVTYLHIPSPAPTPKLERKRGLDNKAFNFE